VREYPQVCLAFADTHHHKDVSVSGQARITNDRDMIKNLWSFRAKAWWQDADGPNILLAEWWDIPGAVVSYVSMAVSVIAGSRPIWASIGAQRTLMRSRELPLSTASREHAAF